MRLISLTRLWRRRWRARCSAQLVPVAPSSRWKSQGSALLSGGDRWGELGGDGSGNIAIMASDCMVINGDYQ